MLEYTTDSVVVELQGEPRGKGRARFSRKSGRAYTPAETVSYEGALRVLAQQVMSGRPPFEGPVSVEVVAYFSIPQSWSNKKKRLAETGGLHPTKKPDWDNLAKVTDSLNGVVWRDDTQVVVGRILKLYNYMPSLHITVKPII